MNRHGVHWLTHQSRAQGGMRKIQMTVTERLMRRSQSIRVLGRHIGAMLGKDACAILRGRESLVAIVVLLHRFRLDW
jgi:hypothetical protein